MQRKSLTPEEKQRVKELYERGVEVEALSKRFDIGIWSIRRALRANATVMRPAPETRRRKTYNLGME